MNFFSYMVEFRVIVREGTFMRFKSSKFHRDLILKYSDRGIRVS